jgi:hypothetical protein
LNLRQRALDEAKQLIGVMEQGGNNQGKKVMEIIRANGGTGPEAWCGDFVAYCYRKAGSATVTRPWAAVRFLGRLTGQRIIKRAPKPGDIVVFKFDHTGLLVKQYKTITGKRKILTIEGNTGASGAVSDSKTGGDGIYLKRRDLSQVKHFVRVLR